MIVLDASALLAFMFREKGHQRVREVIEESCMCCVNMSEVIGRFARDGHDVKKVRERLCATSIEWFPFDAVMAELAASLVPVTRHLGLSLGDRACLALALYKNIPALTADRAWDELTRTSLGISIEIIR